MTPHAGARPSSDPGPATPDDEVIGSVAAAVGNVDAWMIVVDFDGTLSEIVDRPDDAGLVDGAADVLERLAARRPVVVLSGRPVDDLLPRLGELPVTVVGGHGAEARLPDGERQALHDTTTTRETLDAVVGALEPGLDEAAGWQLERKPASVAVHYRRVSPDVADRDLPAIRDVLTAHADRPPGWEVLDGKAVTELRPHGIDKGAALHWLADRFPGRRALVIGDDVTDEQAFEVAVERGGAAVLVAAEPRPTAARWRLTAPTAVVALLHALA